MKLRFSFSLIVTALSLGACATAGEMETEGIDTPANTTATPTASVPPTNAPPASAATPGPSLLMPVTEQLEATIQAAQGGLTDMPIGAAVSNIEGWEQRLRNADNPALIPIADNLEALQVELQSEQIDGQQVGRMLVQLGEQTIEAASMAEPEVADGLVRLGNLLRQTGARI